ncbi:MAG: hypothetical protein CIT01_08215 [Methanobacterium sp. BRmetb2]|jgi:histone H3/H4|nr:MAG: hypothetical protein CIT01_08215 [Methanobacterium sp. BRmetb2]
MNNELPEKESQEELQDESSEELLKESQEDLEDESSELQEDLEDESSELQEDLEDESSEESQEDLPFAKAEVVRLMKKNLDSDKMIRERVKVEMNIFLGEVLERVCEQLNEYPYTTIEYEMLKESIYPYKNIVRINEEKERILKHLDAIKADCDALSLDVKRTLRLKDIDVEDEF